MYLISKWFDNFGWMVVLVPYLLLGAHSCVIFVLPEVPCGIANLSLC